MTECRRLGWDESTREQLHSQLQAEGLEKARLLDYLFNAPVVLAGRRMTHDRFDSAAPPIPVVFVSDGPWVWSIETATYIDRYNLGLPFEFLKHVVQQGGVPPTRVSDAEQSAAIQGIRGSAHD